MSPRPTFRDHFTAVAATLILSSGLASAEGPFARPPRGDAAALERARAGAVRRLQAPECQKLLTDFTDPDGRTLLANLEAWQRSVPEYLERAILFLDGSRLPGCRKPTVILVTSRGRLPVFVCPANARQGASRFAEIERTNGALAEAMVIHEMLHTLGLGENPPSNFEITERVRARCR